MLYMNIKIPKYEQVKILEEILNNLPHAYEKIIQQKNKEKINHLKQFFNN
jgi:hypothetical protein